MWLERKSASDKVGSSITSPFLVLAEHAKSKLSFNSLKAGISNHSLFLKNLACIFLCVYMQIHYFLYTHINVYLTHMIFISKQPPNGTLSPLSSVSLSHTIPLSLAVSHVSELHPVWHVLPLGIFWSEAWS